MVVAALVVGVTVVVAALVVVAAFVVVGALGEAVSDPPEQAETNMARTRNEAALRLMVGVCHGAPQRYSVTALTCWFLVGPPERDIKPATEGNSLSAPEIVGH